MNILLGGLFGAGAGFALGYFGRCRTGMCPLTSNPWISMVIGAIVGAAIAAG